MVTMEDSEIQTLITDKELPIFKSRRRRPLSSRTVDTFLHILSVCSYADSSNPDKVIETDVPLDYNDSAQMSMDEIRHDHVTLGEKKDLSQEVDTNPSTKFDGESQGNYDTVCSSPHLPTTEDAEEGEISGDSMDDAKSGGEIDFKPRDCMGSEAGVKNDNNLIPLFTEAVENGGSRDVAGVVNKITRNLVDYSEIVVHAKSQESAKQATKNQDLKSLVKDSGAQNNKKRKGSCTKEERKNKKSKKSVDPTTCPKSLTLLGEHLEGTCQKVVDASANKVACNEKKKKRVLTEERKAKKKMKARIKRAEKNRKLGIKRLRLEPVIKEKKITYCRHYMNGRCHEGEKCKFSHDTTPLTKSKPCCHFARNACMKGNDCPYDHQLSKYPCNNFQTKGSCNRGSDCMFSHEVQPSEASLNEANKSKPEQKPPSNSSSEKVETKSCSVPKLVGMTPKSTQPPKGIHFLSREKLPLESRASPKVDSEVKEITKTPPLIKDYEQKSNTPQVAKDSEEITKTPTMAPRGINFLSFGKKPGLDYSGGGHSFRISNGVEKSRLSDVAGESLKANPMINVVNKVKVDFSTDTPNSLKKPMPMMPFMSSMSQKALQSTLAFATVLDSGVKSKV